MTDNEEVDHAKSTGSGGGFHIRMDIMWYAVMITSGMIIATAICCFRARKHGLSSDRIINFVIICIPAGIVGARLYYVVFNWSMYSGDLLSVFNTRAGGLAIHGGLIFGIGAALILCYVWKVRPLNILDLAVPSIAIAQAIGRWGITSIRRLTAGLPICRGP